MWQSSNIQKCGICSLIESHLTKVTSLFWFPIRSMMSRWHGQMKHSYQLVASSPHHCSDWMWRAKYVYGVRPHPQHSSCESGWNRRSWQCSQNLCRPLFIEVKHYCIKPPFSGIAHLLYCPPLSFIAHSSLIKPTVAVRPSKNSLANLLAKDLFSNTAL